MKLKLSNRIGKTLALGVGFCLVAGLASTVDLQGLQAAAPTASAPATKGNVMSFYDLTAKDIDGKEVALKQYAGKVTLVVNVASQCGFTPQYTGLQKLYTDYKDRGLVVLGFPSNEFGGQEPGTEAEIKTFCTTRFNVNFPMFSKVSVKTGDSQSPVYSFLTRELPAPKWNFTKYLVDKKGKVLNVYASGVAPDSAELKKAIEDALAAQ